MENIQLKEYENTTCVDLAREDIIFLEKYFDTEIQVSHNLSRGEYRLNPQQYVGIIKLPSGRQLESKPRFSVENIFYMMLKSSKLHDEDWKYDRESSLEETPEQELFELITKFFIKNTQELITKGLYRTYKETQENLVAIRGRIDFREDLRYNLIMNHRKFCRFEELTTDIPHNQVILQTAQLLIRSSFVKDSRLILELNHLHQRLSGLSNSNFTTLDVEKFDYNRMNDHYEPIHKLCSLIISWLSLSENVGVNESPAFIIDMNKLFEKFVTQVLIETVNTWEVLPQYQVPLEKKESSTNLRPDIVIRQKGSEDKISVVADCKYKKFDKKTKNNLPDIYQVLAYCTVTKSDFGLLIYPTNKDSMDTEDIDVTIKNTEITIKQIQIKLDGTLKELKDTEKEFGKKISAYASDQNKKISA